MMNNRELAPVILFTYNRPEHTAKVLDALSENYLASISNLYVFCDGPKNDKVIEKNKRVRQIINAEKGKGRFKTVTIIESETNKGLAKSIIYGVTEVIRQYGRCIVLEDDLITSRYFLTFMNDALEFYKSNKAIWSITGFSFNLKSLAHYDHDVYLSYRANSHSWGTWIDRWNDVDWEVKDFEHLSHSPIEIYHFNKGGNDLYRMLRHQMHGERDSWAIRFCYSQSKHGMFAVYPKYSLVKNIGFDGTGTHCQKNDSIDYSNFTQDIESIKLENVDLDKRLVREFKKMFRVSFGEAIEWLVNKIRLKLKGMC